MSTRMGGEESGRTGRPGVGIFWLVMLLVCVFGGPAVRAEEDEDPPTRVARLAYVEGPVGFQPQGTGDWVSAPLNRPLTTGDQLWADSESRAELQLDGSLLRLGSNTAISFINLDDHITQVQLSSGTLLVRVARLDDDESYEIDTPNLAFSVLRPGVYRLTIDGDGNTTAVAVQRGQGEVTGGGMAYSVRTQEYARFAGTDSLTQSSQSYLPPEDAFDAWSAGRDERADHSLSARYVSPEVIGYSDLDDQGSWQPTPEYGYVWFPRVAVGWAPYRDGHWAWIEPWGYTWVDDHPWGFAPFHYGRWCNVRGAWGWVPGPRAEGAVYARPVYAPALVAWVGAGAAVAWFALGPHDVYVPSYHVSRHYLDVVNVSNTVVSTTIVHNVYNTTIVNRTVNVTNVDFVNRRVPGAVIATNSGVFASAAPVGRNRLNLDSHLIASAPVRAFAPAALPTRAAVLGGRSPIRARPPRTIEARPVVVRTPPPRPLPGFDQRRALIENNAGRPLSLSQLRQVPGSGSPRATLQVAPPPRMLTSPPALHPRDLPAMTRPAAPATADSALERQRLQAQQHLWTQQQTERNRMQQQQELEHEQLGRRQPDFAARSLASRNLPPQRIEQNRGEDPREREQAAQAQREQAAQAQRAQMERQLEAQHQQHTKSLMQHQAQEQQQLPSHQQSERRQQENRDSSSHGRGPAKDDQRR